MVMFSLMLIVLQIILDYVEPTQHALLIKGICPVLPLIWNTPDSKQIQNKQQHEQTDYFSDGGGSGGYTNQHPMANMALSNQAMTLYHGTPSPGAHHIPAAQNDPMADMCTAQNGLYATGSHAPQSQGLFAHMAPQLCGLQPQPIDCYILQGNSSHNQGISPSHVSRFSGVFWI